MFKSSKPEPFTVIERSKSSSKHQVYSDYEHSYSGTSFDLDVQLRGYLREQYPKHILTVVPENNVSLLYYAAAGKAYAKLDLDSDNALRYRGYIRDAQPGVGHMAESIRFAKYGYRVKEEDFILYLCQQGMYMYQYILKEKSEGETINGQSKATDALLAAIGEWNRPEPVGDDIVYVYDGYWRASRDLYRQVQNSTWDDVILDEDMKTALTEIVKKFFDSKDVYDDLGVPWKRGVMFHGPAGNGKTISIKALMHTLHDRKISIPSLYVKSATQTYNIRAVFQFARQMAPCMLVLEDIDTIVTKNTRSYFFNEVDGLENNDGLLMVGSTNHLDQLDPGLSKRPSRFDRKYLFPLPSEAQRTKYCLFWRDRLLSKKTAISFPKKLAAPMAGKMDGFSFAYMKEAFVATLLAIANKHAGSPGDETIAASLSLPQKIQGDGDKSGDDDLDDYELWREFQVQVKILRDDMDTSASEQGNLMGYSRVGMYDSYNPGLPPPPPPPIHDLRGMRRRGGDDSRMLPADEYYPSEAEIMPQLDRSETKRVDERSRPVNLRWGDDVASHDLEFWRDGALEGRWNREE